MSGELVLQLLIYGVTSGAVVALSAVGFSLTYAVARQINFAHGNVFALTTVLVAWLAGALGLSTQSPLVVRLAALVLLLLVGMLFAGVLNLGVERLAFRPFRGGDPLAPLVASVGLAFVLLQAAIAWRALLLPPGPGPRPHHGVIEVPLRAVPDLIPRLELGGGGLVLTLKDVLVVVLALLVAVGVDLLLRRTRPGRMLRAAAEDLQLAMLCGVDGRRASAIAFLVGGMLTGAAALVFAVYHGGAYPQHGLRSGLAAMTAAVLGGVGSARGALAAGVALGVFGAFSDFLLDPQLTPILILGLLVALLAWRPSGLLGEAPAAVGPSWRVAPAGGNPRPPTWLWAACAGAAAYPLADRLLGLHLELTLAEGLILVLLALGLNVVVGYAGMLDLGYAAFFAVGSYTAALLTARTRWPAPLGDFWLALPAAAAAAGLVGALLGMPTLRTRGEYLAMVTLAFGEIVPGLLLYQAAWTGGPRGISGLARPRLGSLSLDAPWFWYLLALGLAALALLACLRLGSSRLGRAWLAVHEDVEAAAGCGVDPWRVRMLAFAIGAGLAGLAGATAAGLAGYVDPGQFDLTVSLMVLAAVVIGGGGGPWGAVLGGLVVAAYDRLAVQALSATLRTAGESWGLPLLAAADLRQANLLAFGLALYLAVRWRSQR